jgi:hypothetical protein
MMLFHGWGTEHWYKNMRLETREGCRSTFQMSIWLVTYRWRKLGWPAIGKSVAFRQRRKLDLQVAEFAET